ncbi:MAG: DUF2249 domain-containing protein [Gammaproteobacteria bacterium]|nr:DUF2249 domain-containing protein [Gammaproteobacteria bacterium]
MAREIVLDVHELPAPEPMEQALDALEKMTDGEYIKMIHRMQPFPLYNILFENGFKYEARDGTTGFDIYIWHAKDTETEQFIKHIKN